MQIPGMSCFWVATIIVSTAIAADVPDKSRVGTPMKVLRYAQQLVEQYDDDGDGQLDEEEWSRMHGAPKLVDRNRDGAITVAELSDHVTRYGRRLRIRLMPAPEGRIDSFPSLLKPQERPPRDKLTRLATQPDEEVSPDEPRVGTLSPSATEKNKLPVRKFTVPASRLPKGLPSWFRVRDRDGDAQLSLAEFAPDGEASAVEEYLRYDLNGDGMVTAQEALRASQLPGSRSKMDIEADAEEVPDGIDAEMAEAGPEEPASPAAARVPSSSKDKAELKKAQRDAVSPAAAAAPSSNKDKNKAELTKQQHAQRVRPDKPVRSEKPK